ncbi:MAG: endonuclease/exonuclease/phosphatase family protein [Anaerolineales bacterium]|nr:endonuclease/exonuclease/phosphatase family protein [Anaerolineales bacterium]
MDVISFEFKLMTFNIEYGGTNVDFSKVVEVIQKTDPHTVAIEEAFGHIPRLADELGWKYYDTRLQIVSQLPLLDPPDGEGIYTFVQIAPGKIVAVSNVHLPNDPEGSFAVLKGATAEQIVELEKKARLPYIQPHLDVLPRLASNGMPVFLAGDFNAPSHLDWTEDMVGVRKQIKYAMEWTVSKAVMDAGFRDSFREAHPDPKTEPGLTWWANRPQVNGWNPNPDDPQDRIDFIYAAGSSVTLESIVIGEETVSPFPSDHRAVMSTFAVTPADMPAMVTTDKRLVEAGELIHVWVNGSGQGGERCELIRRGELTPTLSQSVRGRISELSFSTKGIPSGAYELVLLDERSSVLSHYRLWVKEAGEGVKLSLDRQAYAKGEPIIVNLENAPGNRWDWLGIYQFGQDPFAEKPLRYLHTNAAIQGRFIFESDGLEAGKYGMLFCIDDNYVCLAREHFELFNKTKLSSNVSP